jgi:hypothetical protein
MNRTGIIGLDFFKEVNGFIEQAETNQAAYDQ